MLLHQGLFVLIDDYFFEFSNNKQRYPFNKKMNKFWKKLRVRPYWLYRGTFYENSKRHQQKTSLIR